MSEVAMKFVQRLRRHTAKSGSSSPVSTSSEQEPEDPTVIQIELNNKTPTSTGESVGVANHKCDQANESDNDNEDVERTFCKSLVALQRETKKLQLMMESVIPKHLIGELREDMMAPNRSNFQKSYLEYYESVSILFADIVGFTKISSKCTAGELVTMLNELFGRFDKAADRNRCLRIKILGDCYYCVSGVPANIKEPEPHAKQCVEMGLDMIDILAELALDLQVPTMPEIGNNNSNELSLTTTKGLKMRIGIHTGQVLCGIMGKKKWQFDVHSNDVKLANHLEQAGLPGRVHISESTLRQLGADYQVEPANGRDRDSYIASVDMETYFVIAPGERRKNSSLLPKGPLMSAVARMSSSPRPSSSRTTPDRSYPSSQSPYRDTIVTLDRNNETVSLLLAAQQPDASSPQHGARLVNGLEAPYSKTLGQTADHHADLQSFSLKTATAATRKSKSSQGIQMASAAVALSNSSTGLDLANNNTFNSIGNATNNLSANSLTVGGSTGRQRFKRTTRAIMNANHFIRTIDSPFANLDSESTGENIDEIICDTRARWHQSDDINKWSLQFKDAQLGRSYKAQQHPAQLARLVRVCLNEHKHVTMSFILTLALVALISLATVSTFHTSAQDHDAPPGGWILYLMISLTIALILIASTLAGKLIYNLHQTELKSRIGFILHEKANKDKARMEQMRECNRSIFFNILPKHVAEYFLQSKQLSHRELYSKPYKTVGVSFATVTNFDEFYQEEEANDHGKGCLNLLNEIICDFDDLLDCERFKAIDKIKTIGTTYMAAIGLLPESKRIESSSSENETDLVEPSELAQQIRTMLEFIMEMRHCLTDISENSFNTYRLRAGINLGPVTAGVIGANKPQYDIWGNTVNVASRMESTCEPNKIQVTEDVYNLLKEFFTDIEFTCRGEINIKGKGMMQTYYVDMANYKSVKSKSRASLVIDRGVAFLESSK